MTKNILVLNCGSQSIKWKVFDEKLNVVKQGKREILVQNDFQNDLIDELSKIDRTKIGLIGHRVVHGGQNFSKPVQITNENIVKLERINYLAPLHNSFNISGIKVCQNFFEGTPQFAVFDTEFFSTLPEKSYTYALPKDIVEKFGFRRYGFQGISHEYAAKMAAETVKKPFNKLKIITCHLGGGASIAAIKNGKAIDTSMGFTPVDGLVMMTRSGSMDPEIVVELVERFSLDRTRDILNKESGIKGICGESDMLKVFEKMKQKDERAKLAFDIFVYSIQKQIGAYFAILGGCDLLVFTGSIGSGLKVTRDRICKDLNVLQKTKILAVEADEELAIVRKMLHSKK